MKETEKHINFTKKSIDALLLPPKDKRYYFYDTKVQGLELMVTHQGSKSFKVYRKVGTTPVRVSLGKYPQMTVEEARRSAQTVIAEMISGKNPNQEKKKVRKEITFGEMFSTFMERYSKIEKKRRAGSMMSEKLINFYLTGLTENHQVLQSKRSNYFMKGFGEKMGFTKPIVC